MNYMTYDEASELAMKAKNPEKGYKLENNTYLVNRGDYFAVRLHSTDVVRIYHDGTYVINSGGWRTVTKKDRINKYAPVYVYQRDFKWYVDSKGEKHDFSSGMKVNESGEILNE
jgi:hypothetical protein